MRIDIPTWHALHLNSTTNTAFVHISSSIIVWNNMQPKRSYKNKLCSPATPCLVRTVFTWQWLSPSEPTRWHKLPHICSFNQSARSESWEPHGHQGLELTHRQVSALHTTGCQRMQNISQKAQRSSFVTEKRGAQKAEKWSMNGWKIHWYLYLPLCLISLMLIRHEGWWKYHVQNILLCPVWWHRPWTDAVSQVTLLLK